MNQIIAAAIKSIGPIAGSELLLALAGEDRDRARAGDIRASEYLNLAHIGVGDSMQATATIAHQRGLEAIGWPAPEARGYIGQRALQIVGQGLALLGV